MTEHDERSDHRLPHREVPRLPRRRRRRLDGDERITTEAATREDLLARLGEIVPDILESRGARLGRLTLIVDWQDLRTVDRTTLAIG